MLIYTNKKNKKNKTKNKTKSNLHLKLFYLAWRSMLISTFGHPCARDSEQWLGVRLDFAVQTYFLMKDYYHYDYRRFQAIKHRNTFILF